MHRSPVCSCQGAFVFIDGLCQYSHTGQLPSQGFISWAQLPSHSTDARGTSPVEVHMPKDFRHILVEAGWLPSTGVAKMLLRLLMEHLSPIGSLLNGASRGGANAVIDAKRLHQGDEENLKAPKTENTAKKQLK